MKKPISVLVALIAITIIYCAISSYVRNGEAMSGVLGGVIGVALACAGGYMAGRA